MNSAMKIITDAAANLTPEKVVELGVEVIPFQVTFMGVTYRDGIDLQPQDLYRLYSENPEEFASTSQPSVGDFKEAYENSADSEILSILLSSGLSGAYSAAEQAAHMVTGKVVTVVDSKMVGPALGWMVEAAAHGAKAGWTKERILDAMERVKQNTITMVAFSDIRYLIHSGRISHLKGIIASVLHLKPVIGMNEVDGRYATIGQERTVSRAVRKMAEVVHQKFGDQRLRLQLMHGSNLSGVEQLRTAVSSVVNTMEEKLVPVTLVLGAHAGPTVIGLAAGPGSVFEDILK
jgi:DegV family protein with EDD domain